MTSPEFETFDFYGTGRIEAAEAGADLRMSGWLFAVEASSREWFALLVPEHEEDSMYAELGNVLASRYAGNLAIALGEKVDLSPPEPIDADRAAGLLASATRSTALVHRRSDGTRVPLITLRISRPMEGSA
jgi:hypothetical protein